MSHKHIAVLFHGGCPDGVGGAYAARKKFGDAADYIPVKHNRPVPENLNGMDLYFIDFCYPKEIMDQLAKDAASITVLDHHEGVRAVAEQFPGVFDASRSGATIAWTYFHPHTPVPKLLSYIEDGDLYTFALPYAREILAYVYSSPFQQFEHLDTLVREVEDAEEFERIRHVGAFFSQYHGHIVESRIHHATIVNFEGYECYLVDASGEFISDTGNRLVQLKPPIALIVAANAEDIRVSLRSTAEVDVAALARKYGGNGHPRAAGFVVRYGEPVPWTVVKQTHDHSVD